MRSLEWLDIVTPTDFSSTPGIRAAIASETIVGGGLAHYTEDLDKALRNYARADQEVVGVPFISPLRNFRQINDSQLRRLLRKSKLLSFGVNTFRRLSKPEQWPQAQAWTERWHAADSDIVAIVPHVVVDDQGKLDAYYATIARRAFVLVIHDLHALHFPEQWRETDVQLMRKRFQFLAEHAKQIIVHNEFTAGDVSEKFHVDRERISIVLLPSFFSEEAFRSSIESDDANLTALDIARPFALWASSSTYSHKNHEQLLYAWRDLVDRGHSIQLVCTGSKAPRWNEVWSLIQKLNLVNLVRFTGTVSDAALAAILRNAHLAICPTLFEGGGPGPAAEAMMAGIPVAVSNIPQCRQLFNNRTDLCSFFDPYSPRSIADAVAEIMVDNEAARRRADFARVEYPRMRTWQGAATQYWQAVEEAGKARDLELKGKS